MASSILKNLKQPTTTPAAQNNGNLLQQFLKFKGEIEASGKNPQDILNTLISSGKVNQQQLNQAKTLAGLFANKYKKGLQ